MQEYLRSGDEYAHGTEVSALEKRAEYSVKSHKHKLDEKTETANKLQRKVTDKNNSNAKLDIQLKELHKAVGERQEIYESGSKKTVVEGDGGLLEIYNRRRLVDLAKAQAQDIGILREEVERLRLRTYPAFSTVPKRGAF
jgi:16S rRNA G1207 methylase RsmC